MELLNGVPSGLAQQELGERTIREVARRIVPFMVLLYFVSFLDRVNIGFAALTMNADVGLSAAAFGIGSGVFFIGYFLFEVPSNVILERVGARRWIARIMISWGLISACFAFVTGPTSFYVLRFLLGVAEAGFFPGMVLYVTYWIPAAKRGRIMAAFLLALPLSNVIGAPLSTALLSLDAGGLKGWQWMFIVEGIPAVILGFFVLRYLYDSPADAPWLKTDERRWLQDELARERAQIAAKSHTSLMAALRNPRVWRLSLVYFGIAAGLYAFGFWLPQIVKSVSGLPNVQTGLLTMLPYAIAAVAMYLWGRRSDRYSDERRKHVAIPAAIAAVGLAVVALPGVPTMLSLLAIIVGTAGIYAAVPAFWTLPTSMLAGTAAAGGIALINSVGNLGGFLGPAAIGLLKDSTGGYGASFGLLAALLLGAALLVVTLKRDPR